MKNIKCLGCLSVMCRVQITEIVSILQKIVVNTQTQSPDCKAVRRRSMYSLPVVTKHTKKKYNIITITQHITHINLVILWQSKESWDIHSFIANKHLHLLTLRMSSC